MRRRSEPLDASDETTHDDAPSKTQLKKAMQELQDLGVALLQLPEPTLARLIMGDRLRDALHELRRLTNHGARARQVQFVGKLMRDEDVAPYRRALAELQAGRVRSVLALKEVERWRERLLDEAEGLAHWLDKHPKHDTKAFRALVQNTRREREQARATAERTHREPTNGPFYRALFKELRTALTPSD